MNWFSLLVWFRGVFGGVFRGGVFLCFVFGLFVCLFCGGGGVLGLRFDFFFLKCR